MVARTATKWLMRREWLGEERECVDYGTQATKTPARSVRAPYKFRQIFVTGVWGVGQRIGPSWLLDLEHEREESLLYISYLFSL